MAPDPKWHRSCSLWSGGTMGIRVGKKLTQARIYFLALLFFCLPAFSASQEDLDKTLIESGTLKKFLKDTNQRQKYYESLKAYMRLSDEEFPVTLYDFILRQVDEMVTEIPSLEKRLMATTGIGSPFSIETTALPEEVVLMKVQWQHKRERWLNKLERERNLAPGKRSKQVKDAQEYLLKLSDELTPLLQLPKRPQSRALGEWFSGVRRDTKRKQEIDTAIATMIHDKIGDPERKILNEGSPSEVASLLSRLADPMEFGFAPQISPFFKDVGITASELEKEGILRPLHETRMTRASLSDRSAGTYNFVPFARRFHGIWKGLKTKECVGGSVGYPTDASPRRWATIALQDTQLHAVEKDGKYLGFIHVVPVQTNPKNPVYGSFDVGSPAFGRDVIDPTTKTRESLFSAWVTAYRKRMPKSWKGLVLSESTAFHNSGVMPEVHESNYVRYGKPMPGSYSAKDHKMEGKIVESTDEPLGSIASGKMIYDAADDEGGKLRLVEPLALSELKDSKKLEAKIPRKGADRMDLLANLLETADSTPQNREILKKRISKMQPNTRAALLEELGLHADRGNLSSNPLIGIAIQTPEEYLNVVNSSSSWFVDQTHTDRSIDNSLELFFSMHPTFDDVESLINQAASSRLALRIAEMAIHQDHDFDRTVELLGLARDKNTGMDNKPAAFGHEMDTVLERNLNWMLEKKLDADQWENLIELTEYTETEADLRMKALEALTDPADKLRFLCRNGDKEFLPAERQKMLQQIKLSSPAILDVPEASQTILSWFMESEANQKKDWTKKMFAEVPSWKAFEEFIQAVLSEFPKEFLAEQVQLNWEKWKKLGGTPKEWQALFEWVDGFAPTGMEQYIKEVKVERFKSERHPLKEWTEELSSLRSANSEQLARQLEPGACQEFVRAEASPNEMNRFLKVLSPEALSTLAAEQFAKAYPAKAVVALRQSLSSPPLSMADTVSFASTKPTGSEWNSLIATAKDKEEAEQIRTVAKNAGHFQNPISRMYNACAKAVKSVLSRIKPAPSN